MGMILEFYAVDADEVSALDGALNDIGLMRAKGIGVGSVSINSAAPETWLSWIENSPLGALDVRGDQASGVLVRHGELDGLMGYMRGANLADVDILNAVVDAALEAKWLNRGLWVGMA